MRELYHATNVYSTLEMLKSGRMRLSMSMGKQSEIKDTKNRYFASFTRSKIGGYHTRTSGNMQTLMVFDGDQLASRYKVEPVDYWGRTFRLADQKSNEMEERLFSNQQYIPIQGKVRAIHVYAKLKEDSDKRDKIRLRQLLIEAKKAHIKIYVYDNDVKWRSMRPSLAIKLDPVELHGHNKPFADWKRRNDFDAYLNLYFAPSASQLTKDGDRMRYKARYYPNDLKTGLNADLHNNAKSPNVDRISRIIQKVGGIDAFLKILGEKADKLTIA